MSNTLYGALHSLPKESFYEVPEVVHLLLCFVLLT